MVRGPLTPQVYVVYRFHCFSRARRSPNGVETTIETNKYCINSYNYSAWDRPLPGPDVSIDRPSKEILSLEAKQFGNDGIGAFIVVHYSVSFADPRYHEWGGVFPDRR